MKKPLVAIACLALIAAAGAVVLLSSRGRSYDPGFDPSVETPRFVQSHPVVLFDEAHHNHHTATTGYRPFARLIENDGFTVNRNRDAFSRSGLQSKAANVLVIVNARGPGDRGDGPAFTPAEAEAVIAWVETGGSLLLVADHFPMGPATAPLAGPLGIEMTGGIVEDPSNHDARYDASHLVFSEDNGLIGTHPIVTGGGESDRVHRVLSFSGQALRVPAGAAAVLALGDAAVEQQPFAEDLGGGRIVVEYRQPRPVAGQAQLVAIERGQGRVVVGGEAAMLTAQRNQDGEPVGMNVTGYDNRQLALNIMRWLAHDL